MDIPSFIEQTVKQAGSISLASFGQDGSFRTKADNSDYVTATDLAIHDYITNEIKQHFPNDGIISEEDEQNHYLIEENGLSDKNYWILDPIDGTNNFATSIPLFGTMLCRLENGQVTQSGVYLPTMDAFYEAEKGKGAFLNKKQIRCTQKKHWKETFGCTNANLSEKKIVLRNALTHAWSKQKFWLSAYGSAAVSGTFIASGKRDWYMTMGSKIWDYAPIALLLQEAGCKVTNFQGTAWTLKDRNMIAANPNLHTNLMKLFD